LNFKRSDRLGDLCNVKVSLPLCLIKYVDMKMYGKWKNSSTYSWFWHCMDVSDHLHNPIDVPPGERCRSTDWIEGWASSQSRSGYSGSEKIFYLCQESNPYRTAPSPGLYYNAS